MTTAEMNRRKVELREERDEILMNAPRFLSSVQMVEDSRGSLQKLQELGLCSDPEGVIAAAVLPLKGVQKNVADRLKAIEKELEQL